MLRTGNQYTNTTAQTLYKQRYIGKREHICLTMVLYVIKEINQKEIHLKWFSYFWLPKKCKFLFPDL